MEDPIQTLSTRRNWVPTCKSPCWSDLDRSVQDKSRKIVLDWPILDHIFLMHRVHNVWTQVNRWLEWVLQASSMSDSRVQPCQSREDRMNPDLWASHRSSKPSVCNYLGPSSSQIGFYARRTEHRLAICEHAQLIWYTYWERKWMPRSLSNPQSGARLREPRQISRDIQSKKEKVRIFR